MDKQRDDQLFYLHKQPHFPMEDLTNSNAEILKYTLPQEAGLDAYAKQLEKHQRYIHRIANRAMRLMHIRTEYSAAELHAFSHGFASFEMVSDLMHEPRVYDTATATRSVAEYLVDTRDLFDIELEREINQPDQDDDETEVIYTSDDTPYRMLLTPSMEDALNHVPHETTEGPITHDKLHPEKIFTETHSILPTQYPHTYDVMVAIGETREETIAQLQLRIAGAGLARTLQTTD